MNTRALIVIALLVVLAIVGGWYALVLYDRRHPEPAEDVNEDWPPE